MLKGKTIVVGVTGGIAAYKAGEVISRLKKLGAEVHVIMTASAQQFITPLTLQTLSKNQVITDMFTEPKAWEVQHISLADKADLMLIVPATANIIGKVVNGIADDMLSTTIMATKAEVIFAPAMNVNMYENSVVQSNIARLSSLGYKFVEPEEGMLACGYLGKGRLASTEIIIDAVIDNLSVQRDLDEVSVLVTAGPTREAIDPVRFITNHSSGKMGYELASQAAKRGARVTLISGSVALKPPSDVDVVYVNTAHEMYEQVMARFDKNQIIIKAAAVADYTPKQVAEQKLKKGTGDLILELKRTKDIIAELGQRKNNQVLIGFAAESEALVKHAKEKMLKKNMDMIVANDITQAGAGFGSNTNVVKLMFPDGNLVELPLLSKKEVADKVLDYGKLLYSRVK